MPQQITNPSILLLDCSIAYQRVEGKLTSLEPVLMQENEYLTRCAARITALRPKVVLVSGSAGRTVQAALQRAGAALALRVPTRALQRLARCSRSDVLTSIDARIGLPRLGTCKNFYVKNYESKTLMVFEGCAEPQLGCCILLRGASLQELIRVKKVVKFMLLACYNWKLEKAFLGDIEATLPEPGTTFDDENDDEDNNESIHSVIKTDDSEVFEQTKMQKDLSNDLFKTDSYKSNDSNSDVFDADGEKLANVSNEKLNFEIFSISDTEKESSANKDKKITSADSAKVKAENNQVLKENYQEADMKIIENSNTDNSNKLSNDLTSITDIKNTESFDVTKHKNIQNIEDSEISIIQNSNNDTENIMALNSDIATDVSNLDTDDPLQRPKFTRKTENLSCGVPIRDFSDPLRATLSVDDEVFLPKEETTLKADAQNERWSADDVVLSMSPNVLIPAPYLATEAGRRCSCRGCFPTPLLAPPPPHTPRHSRPRTHTLTTHPHTHTEYHPFVTMAIRSGPDDPTLKAALANFRATGGRTYNNNHKPSCPQYNPSVVRPKRTDTTRQTSQTKPEPIDPFSPENHQQLNVLLYSYSTKSPNVPDFCVNPWIAVMEMYGRHDISLGAFLHKYCFNSDYKCPSAPCHVPMNHHVRKFVHGDVCITITCNTIGHSSVDKLKEEQGKQVMFWSRCEQCGVTGRARRLSPSALALSLAQNIRWRVSAARCMRGAPCVHAVLI